MGRTLGDSDELPVSNRGPDINNVPKTESRGPMGVQSRRMGEIRVIVPPLNNKAALLANKRFYRKHTNLSRDGKITTLNICNPAHDNLRHVWINLYQQAGGKVKTMSLTHDCSPPIQPAYALVNVEMIDTYIDSNVVITLESHGRVKYSESFLGTGTDDLWVIPFLVELPNIGNLYAIRVEHKLTVMEGHHRHQALKKMNMELHMCIKEKKHWQDEYDYKPSGVLHYLSEAAKVFGQSEPYGADSSGYEQQQADNDKQGYRKNIIALSKFIKKLKLLIHKAERFGTENHVIEVVALKGQLQTISMKFTGEKFPDYDLLLKTSPRKFEMK